MLSSKMSLSEVFKNLHSNQDGLKQHEIQKRQKKYGKNELPEKKKNLWKIFFLQFASPLVFILFGAIFISLLIPYVEYGKLEGHDLIDPLAIVIILVLNAFFGFFQELKAENTLAALKKMQPNAVIVLRNGEKQEIQSEDLVPGDVIFLAEGDGIGADARLLESVELKTIESALTGESNAIEKDAQWTGKGAIGDQKNMVFSGTQVASGRGVAMVTAIGLKTELGKIAELVAQVDRPPTPLEKRLDLLGKKIGIAVIAICVMIFFIALLRDIKMFDALITAVALAVGAVPEGLPAVMTISLAVGVNMMAKKKALVRELRSVETLGNVTVIASDKTGTVTENKMKVVEVYCDGKFIEMPQSSPSQGVKNGEKNSSPLLSPKRAENSASKAFGQLRSFQNGISLLEVAKNCNDAELPSIGDPTEIGLLQIAEDMGIKAYERIDEVPFSSEKKWMSTTHKREIQNSKCKIQDTEEENNEINVGAITNLPEEIEFLKGAPEAIAKFCKESDRQNILDVAEKMAKKGLRTIAAAQRKKGEESAEFLGIFGLQDPPRETVKKSLLEAKEASIRTVMITGDHKVTAEAIGKQVGLIGDAIEGKEIEKMTDKELQEKAKKCSVFARVSPEHKVRICKALQNNGEIVAMTGDGVNDAPAIRQAEVGVSMGKVGTSVARQASDLILLDDNYSTIVAGIHEGRRIFNNIKKSIAFLLRTNYMEVFLILAALLVLPGEEKLPLLAIHLLFLNLLTDSFPALSLAAESAEEDIMKKKPRSVYEGFLHAQMMPIFILGTFGALLGFLSFSLTTPFLEINQAQSFTLATIVCIELLIIFSIRSDHLFYEKNLFSGNPWVLRSVLLGFLLFLIAYFTPLSTVIKLSAFPHYLWIFALLSGVLMFFFAEFLKWKIRRSSLG